MERKSPYPDWVNKHRRPGTEIRKMNDRYYVYEVSSFYDKEKKLPGAPPEVNSPFY